MFFLLSFFTFFVLVWSNEVESIYSGDIPTEGCKGFIFPPGAAYYENTYENETFTEIPTWALEQIKNVSETLNSMIIEDYPIGSSPSIYEDVYTGSAGRAVLYLRIYKNTKDEKYLGFARGYIDVALDRVEPKFSDDNFAFLHGYTGVLAVASVIYDLQGEKEKSEEFLSKLPDYYSKISINSNFDSETGYAGSMNLARYLKKHFGKDVIPTELVERVGHLAFARGMMYSNKSGILFFGPPVSGKYFRNGMGGSGSAGPLYEMINDKNIMGNETIRKHVLVTLDYYLSLQNKEGQIEENGMPGRTQWCHGIPGILPLFRAAYDYFGDQRYLKAIEKGVYFTAKEGILTKGMHLCHGVSGNSYMVLDAYRKTKNPIFLSKAISMILTSLKTPELTDPKKWVSYDCRPNALYESSSLGMTVFFSDILANYKDLSKLEMVGFHVSI